MSRLRRGLRTAKLAATRSDLYAHRVGAALYRKKKLVATGTNVKKTHPNCPNDFTQHAEFNAISKFSPEELKGCTLYIARLTRTDRVGIAKPCDECAKLLKTSGLRKVYYTNQKGRLVEWEELN